jgi:hypothetical protein
MYPSYGHVYHAATPSARMEAFLGLEASKTWNLKDTKQCSRFRKSTIDEIKSIMSAYNIIFCEVYALHESGDFSFLVTQFVHPPFVHHPAVG